MKAGAYASSARRTLSKSFLWPNLSRASKRLIASGIAFLLLMVIAVALMMIDMRAVAQRDAQANLGKLGIAIAEQTARSIQSVDLVLQELNRYILSEGVETPEQFKTLLTKQSLYQLLNKKSTDLPQADAFTIVDADGKLVNFSRQWPIPDTDLSDRDYYHYLRANDDHSVYFSKPVQNRGNGGWTIYLVRRIDGPTGQFLGMVLGAINLDYFRDFYSALTFGSDTTVSLLQRNGTVLTGFPSTAKIGEVVPPLSPWHQIVASKRSTSFTTQGWLTQGLRAVSVHPLAVYPLVVNVSASEWDVLANWRRATTLAALGTGSAVLCMLVLLWALTFQLERLERLAFELRSSQQHLAEKSTMLEATLGHMNQGIMMINRDGMVVIFNKRVVEMLNLPPELMTDNPSFNAVLHYQRSINEFANVEFTSPAGRGEVFDRINTYERMRPNGSILEIQSVPLADGGMVRTYTDITERKRSEEKVRYFAHHDDLTKLVNRMVFQERLMHAIELADRSKRSIAVMYLDLDRFKQVNDTLGHAAGDTLLVGAAKRLRSTVRDIDTVARMGGDEFAIIQPLVDQPNSSVRLAERAVRLIEQPFTINGVQCSVGVSIGIALYPDHASNAKELLRNADTALYRAKSEGRGVVRMFNADIDTQQGGQFKLEQDLHAALALHQFEVDYQPIVDSISRRPVSCEALVRWRHPTRGLVSPAGFIEIAESSGLIIPIGLWVLTTACTEAATWPASIGISVNLSPAQFNAPALADDLAEILRKTGLAPTRLTLEVTEGLLLEEQSSILQTMSRLRALGVHFSLDDFGTAHAGLSYLRRFPFDSLKIDKSFIQDIIHHQEARAIVAGILGIGAALDLFVISEGVETEEQLVELQKMNCRQVQGYLTGRPQSGADMRSFLLSAPDRPVSSISSIDA